MFGWLKQHSQLAAQSLRVKSALNPTLWLTAIATPICLFGAYLFRDKSPVFEILVYAGVSPIFISLLGFCFFAVFKPEKLQSEDYQIRHESLQIIQQKTGAIEIPAASLEQIVNPVFKSIENKGDAQ